MNRKLHRTIAGLSATLVCALPFAAHSLASHADASLPSGSLAADRLAIQAAYQRIDDAFVANDMDNAMPVFAQNYTQTDPKGHVLDLSGTRRKFQSLRNQILTAHIDCSITAIAATPAGDKVDMTSVTTGTGQKRVLFMRFNGTFTTDQVAQDLWVHTVSGWQLRSRKLLVDVSRTRQG